MKEASQNENHSQEVLPKEGCLFFDTCQLIGICQLASQLRAVENIEDHLNRWRGVEDIVTNLGFNECPNFEALTFRRPFSFSFPAHETNQR